MTDFFADLEREIRAAHPRRSRPVVPVAPVLMALVALVAVVSVVWLLPAGEREVAQQPPPAPSEGWTAYAPLDCESGRVVDGTIPDEIVDRFAILRGDAEPATLPDDRLPSDVAEVVHQSVRPLAGPEDTKFAFAVARMFDDRCRPGDLAVCLISVDSRDGVCAPLGQRRVQESFVRDLDDGRQVAAALGEDGVPNVRLSAGGPEIELEGNVGFEVLTTRSDQSVTPFGCAGRPQMGPLKERFAIFREPPATNTDGIEMSLPDGYQTVHLTEARAADLGRGLEYVVVPVGDSECRTAVCLVRMGAGEMSCSGLPASADRAVVLQLAADGRFAALVTDGVRSVNVTTTEENQELEVDGSVVAGAVSGEVIGVYAGS